MIGRAGDWAFSKRFRRGGFGWRASRLASERIAEALAEIHAVARHDPLHAAVRFLVKLSPALERADSSSGALGGAARAVVDALVPLIAQAPGDTATREGWLEQLFEAIQNDDPPDIELRIPADRDYGNGEVNEVISLRQGGHFSRGDGGLFKPLIDSL